MAAGVWPGHSHTLLPRQPASDPDFPVHRRPDLHHLHARCGGDRSVKPPSRRLTAAGWRGACLPGARGGDSRRLVGASFRQTILAVTDRHQLRRAQSLGIANLRAQGAPRQGHRPCSEWLGATHRLRVNFRLNKHAQQSQRLLPAEIAHFDRDHVGNAFLHDAQVGAAGNCL